MSELIVTESMPIMALRGLSVFPGALLHFDVGRSKSVRAVNEAMGENQRILLVSQKDIEKDDPELKDLYEIGTICKIKQVLRLPGDNMRILVEGESRGRIAELLRVERFLYGRVETVTDQSYAKGGAKAEAYVRLAASLFEQYSEYANRITPDIMFKAMYADDPSEMADIIAQNLFIEYAEKQKLLAELHPVKRLRMACDILSQENEVLRLQSELQEKMQDAMNKNQREYVLREQLRVIQSELGEDESDEIQSYKDRIQAIQNIPNEVREKLLKEVARLEKQTAGGSDAAVLRNYLDICLELPWDSQTKERLDVRATKKILDDDHFGLEPVKERILEMLSVKKLSPSMGGQIICLVGPPGTGKTSVSMSIARALNRKLVRVALGGVHDEADIRGHRRTYIGAMPGRIINGLREAGTNNPLMLLDEIDKLGSDYRGDPSSALLEALDAEQNDHFTDHYLEIPFDLGNVMFITTANTTSTIPAALLDRMEVIELTSYTDEEKLEIAKRHLLPKQIEKNGLKRTQLRVTDDALREVITGYTRESGVRNMERELGKVCRKAAMRIVSDSKIKRVTVNGGNLPDFLGVRKYQPDALNAEDQVGVVTGLAWTSVGGDTLEVECNVTDGTGKLELTGNLGSVMKESVQAAMSYIRSRADVLGLPKDFYQTKDIHVHFPEGAVPKDGPSAGVTICTAIVSALTNSPVRRDLAMTGEITIRGRVLAIGGLKEKTMAALRRGVKTVIIPADNEQDLEEIDQTVRKALNFITVKDADAVLKVAMDLSHCKPVEVSPADQSIQEITADPAPDLLVPTESTKRPRNRIRQ